MSCEISTDNAPAAIGPYVQGVDLGSMIITSGQIPVDPATGLVADDVTAQARVGAQGLQEGVDAFGRPRQEQVDALFGQQDRALERGQAGLLQQAQAQRRQAVQGNEFVGGDIDDGSHGKTA